MTRPSGCIRLIILDIVSQGTNVLPKMDGWMMVRYLHTRRRRQDIRTPGSEFSPKSVPKRAVHSFRRRKVVFSVWIGFQVGT